MKNLVKFSYKKSNPYETLKKLEDDLRILISSELSKISQQWWKQRIPGDVKQNAKNRKEKEEKRGIKSRHSLIYYVDFTDYAKIITRSDNWEDVFKYIFHDKNAIAVKLRELEPVRNSISHTRNLTKDDVRKLEFYTEDIRKGIDYYKKQKKKLKPRIRLKKKQAKLEFRPLTILMSTSSDRTVYPLDSVIYVRANLPQFLYGEKIIFELYDEKRKLLDRNEIDPLTFDHPALKYSGIYETSFKMQGSYWKVGKTYIARAKHGNAIAEDSFFIDERMPVVQSDKLVYLWGTDMILTVIDPDADKDSQLPEFVGDRPDSKLVISSSKADLVNYRLRETGNSTGIFQGIVGFIGVDKDGKTEGYDVNDEIITKTQGKEIHDGFIEVSEYEEMIITYTNRVGTANLTVFVVKEIPINKNVE